MDRLSFWTGLAFGATLLAFLGLSIRAAIRVHRKWQQSGVNPRWSSVKNGEAVDLAR